MKIDNLDILNKIQNINTNTQKNEIETESFKKAIEAAQKTKDTDKLRSACQQFETVFIQMLMKNMRSTVVNGGFIEKSHAREMFEGMLDEEIAKEVSRGQGIGIGDMMYEQLSRIQKGKKSND